MIFANPVCLVRTRACRLFVAVLAVGLSFGPSRVQAQADADKPAAKLDPPETLDLKTSDGLQLKATFFPSKLGRDAVPVILLHGYKGKRGDFEALAAALQQKGHAVLVPDLRGHGDSLTIEGQSRKLEADTLPANQYPLMVTQDLEACKKYLMGQHNEGNLNIEKLCVVGADLGALVGALWSKLDWSWPPLATGKQGQDVRALVLLSPPWTHKTLKMNDAISDPRIQKELSVFIAVGESKHDSARDAKRIHSELARHHPEPPQEKLKEEKDLFYLTFKTSLQGTKLLNEMPTIGEQIARFIELRLVDKDIPWKARKLPLQD